MDDSQSPEKQDSGNDNSTVEDNSKEPLSRARAAEKRNSVSSFETRIA